MDEGTVFAGEPNELWDIKDRVAIRDLMANHSWTVSNRASFA
jgi:hypothetical protein